MSRVEISGLKFSGFDSMINMSIQKGDFFAITGTQSGLTTSLLRAISGFEQPVEGSIFLHNVCVFDAEQGISLEPGERNLRVVFSDEQLIPFKSVLQNLSASKGDIFHKRKTVENNVDEVLRLLGLDTISGLKAYKLTKFQSFMVKMAKALISESTLVIIEDPFRIMERDSVREICQTIKQICHIKGLTVILETANPTLLGGLATKIAVLEERFVQIGSVTDLYKKPLSISVAKCFGYPLINLIAGTAQLQRGFLTIQSPLGIWQFPAEDSTIAAGVSGLFDCIIGIRAEDLRFEKSNPSLLERQTVLEKVVVSTCCDSYFITDTIRTIEDNGVAVGYNQNIFVVAGDLVSLQADKTHSCIFYRKTGLLVKGYSPKEVHP